MHCKKMCPGKKTLTQICGIDLFVGKNIKLDKSE